MPGTDVGSEERTEKLLKRLEAFCATTMHHNSSSGLQVLIKKLQEGLATEENFPVYASQLVLAPRYSSHYNSKPCPYGPTITKPFYLKDDPYHQPQAAVLKLRRSLPAFLSSRRNAFSMGIIDLRDIASCESSPRAGGLI